VEPSLRSPISPDGAGDWFLQKTDKQADVSQFGAIMATLYEDSLRTQLVNRRQKLSSAVASFPGRLDLTSLLEEVDAALSRMEMGTFGLCETCHDPIEKDLLAADPLIRFCLDHLSEPQQRALEQDLDLAARIQSALLPKPGLVHGGWRTAFHYQPAGLVSGDYCDLIPAEDGSLYFILGDVSGKGIAASMLMSHLQAMFRTLTSTGLALNQIIERASRLFCESTLSNHFATLVCGKAEKNGDVALCNAGHLAPLLGQGGTVRTINATGLPLGMFCSEEFSIEKAQLGKGDCLLFFTDGLSEAHNPAGAEFGVQPLIDIVKNRQAMTAQEIVDACVAGSSHHRSASPLKDDLTVLVLERLA
jgi:phosphoserine phosphatase RsbU/P